MLKQILKHGQISVLYVIFLFTFSYQSFSQCTAAFNASALEGCEPLNILFNDTSDGTVQQRTWDFGDGSATSNAQNPTHSYNAGLSDTTYVIMLAIECSGGIKDTIKDTVIVYARPNINFTIDSTTFCAFSDTACFINLSDTGTSYTYQWNFGDLTASTDFEPCHIYSADTTYDVRLDVISNQACLNSLTISDMITVLEAPSPAFVVDTFTGCYPLAITFTNTTDTTTTTIKSWLWDWGDTSSSSLMNPGSHTFNTPNTFFVKLQATNTLGCTNSTSQAMVVKETPTSIFTATNPICINENATVTYTGSSDTTATYTWNFDGGNATSGTGQGPHTVTWDTGGFKILSLSVDLNGCMSSNNTSVTVNTLPFAFILSSDADNKICDGDNITFTVVPTNYSTYNFFVNGSSAQSSSSNTFQTTTLNDKDTITIVVTDANGCTNNGNDTSIIKVDPKPTITLSSSIANDTICKGDTVVYTATPSGYDDYIFYDGFVPVQSGINNILTYPNQISGDSITVVATNDACSDRSNAILITIINPLSTSQVNCSNSTDTSITFAWDSINGTTGYQVSVNGGAFSTPSSGASSLTHTEMGLSGGDTVTITVMALGNSPCGNSDTSLIATCYAIVCNTVTFDKSPAPTICQGDSITVSVSNISATSYSVSWNGGTPSANTSFTSSPSTDTAVFLTVLDSTQLSCPSTTKYISITVNSVPSVSLTSSVSNDTLCQGDNVTFTALPAGYDNYDFYNGFLLVQTGANNIYSTNSLNDCDNIEVIATNSGCLPDTSNMITNTVVTPLSTPQVNCGIATNTSVQFTWDSIAGSWGYEVSVNGSAFTTPSSGATGLVHVLTGLNPNDAVVLLVRALDNAPCGNSAVSAPATCYSIPCNAITFNQSPAPTICNGDSTTLSITNISATNYSVIWNGGTATTSTTYTFSPTSDTTVSVMVIDSSQLVCPPPTKYFIITVNPVPAITLSSSATNDSICKGETIIFTITPDGYDNYDFYSGFLLLQTGGNNRYTASSWNNGDSINVTSTNQGCTGTKSNTITTTVAQPLSTPQVNCSNTTLDSIEFAWDTVAGATGYQVGVNGGPYITPSSGSIGLTTHLITGLSPGASATIDVIALGNTPCGNSAVSNTITCYATPCSAVTFNRSADPSICNGQSTILSITNINATNYSVSWSGGVATSSTTYTLSPTSDTTIFVAVIDSSQLVCPPTTKYFNITVNALPSVTLTSSVSNDSICQGNAITFTANPAGYNNYDFYDGFLLLQTSANNVYSTSSWSDGDSISVISTDLSCVGIKSNTITTTVIQPPSTPQVNCGSSTDSTIQFSWDSVTGAIGYQVSIDGGSFTTPSSGTMGLTHLLTGVSSGDSATIRVQALGSSTCGNSTASTAITCYALICNAVTFNKSAVPTICKGDTATLSISNISASAYSVSWNGGASTTDTTYSFSPNNNTSVSITVTDSAQLACPSATKYINVTVNPIPAITLTSSSTNDTICKGSSISFATSPAGYDKYDFYSGYLLLTTGANNVYTTSSWTDGDSINVFATDKGCISTSSNKVTTAVNKPLFAPQVNCSNTTNTTIEFAWDAVAGANGYQGSIDGGTYITPSSGAMGLTHLLTGLSPDDSATISMQALGNSPCGNSAVSATVTCYAKPCNAITFDRSVASTICVGDTVSASISNISATSYAVSWNGGAASTTTSFSTTPNSDTTISVAITDSSQLACPAATKYINITVNPIPTIALSSSIANDSICEGSTVTFTASPVGYDNYKFYDDTTLMQSSPFNIFSTALLDSGNSVYIVATDLGCSINSSKINTTVLSLPAVTVSSSVSNDTICGTDTVTFTASPSTFKNYLFYKNNSLMQDSTINTYIAPDLISGDSVTALAVNKFGCKGNQSAAKVTSIFSLPTIALTSSDADSSICAGESITFTASLTNLSKYQFYDGSILVLDSTINSFITDTLASGNNIFVIGTDANGCMSDTSNVIITIIKPTPDPTVSLDTTICTGSSVTLSVSDTSSSTTFIWSNSKTTNTITISPTTTTIYSVTGTLEACSATADTVTVTVDITIPVADAGIDVTICKGDSVQLDASGGKSYIWLPDTNISSISDPYVSPDTTTVYTVTVYNIACFDTNTIIIIVDKCLTQLSGPIPQIITPNGDGKNDTWLIPDAGYFTENKVIIYNRWGNVVYDASPYTNDWDGTSNNGDPLPDGTYFYVLDLGNATEHYTGFVMIYR